MLCRICNTSGNHEVFQVREMMFGTRNIYQYFRCSTCHCLQILLPESDPKKLYPAGYYSFNTYGTFNVVSWIKRLIIRYSVSGALGEKAMFSLVPGFGDRDMGAHSLKGYISKESKILDVGSGDGSLIRVLYELGFKNVTGIDPFLSAEVRQGRMALLRKDILQMDEWETYDVIMMHHSFEHVENPREVLQQVKRLLTEKGVCIIRIPVSDSYAFEQYGCNWIQLDAPRHICLHTKKSMELLVGQTGLKLGKVVDDSGAFQFLGSEQYKAGIPLNDVRSFFVPFYKKLFFNKKHIFSRKQIREFNKKAAELNAEGRGDQRIFYLTKA
ncbi:MAG: class I SAM-dependent methyltransferase [Chitinophagaceae bacterium]|nr:class I SAM-dependent methyltransferase [Chitinophagaceae bacterium]